MSITSQVPDAGTPIFDDRGYINPVWHSFFFMLLRRTGGTEGVDPVEQNDRINSLERRADETEVYEYSEAPSAPVPDDFDLGYAWNHGVQYDPLHHAIATTIANGFMSSADKTKLDSVTAGAAVASVSGSAPIQSSGGTTPSISIVAATSLAAGSMSAADKAKLDGMTAGAAVASVSGTAPIVSSGGTTPAISITPATTGAAGSMSAADKMAIDSLAPTASPTFAEINLTQGHVVFPATQVPSANANTLDDYEEGTWTPTLTCSTPGDLNVVYSVRAAIYTKVGRLVTASFVIQTSTFTRTTAAGGLLISGFPFAMSGITSVAGKLDWSGVTKAGFTDISLLLPSGSAVSQVIANGSGVARASVLITDLPSGGTVYLSGSIQYTSA